MSSFLTQSLSVWPHAHLHMFISDTYSFFQESIIHWQSKDINDSSMSPMKIYFELYTQINLHTLSVQNNRMSFLVFYCRRLQKSPLLLRRRPALPRRSLQRRRLRRGMGSHLGGLRVGLHRVAHRDRAQTGGSRRAIRRERNPGFGLPGGARKRKGRVSTRQSWWSD